MLLTVNNGRSRAKGAGPKYRRTKASVNTWLVLLAVAAIAAFAVACGEDTPPTPAPLPTSAPEATATSAPQPTAAPAATAMPEPTATSMPQPTAVPTATAMPEPTATPMPQPTAVPTATAMPEPTATPMPQPTAVPTATAMPEPTATPMPEPTAVPAAAATPVPAPEPAPVDDEALTRDFVTSAVDYYGQNGLDATVEFYRSEAGSENGRTLILVDTDENTLLVYRSIPALQGQFVGPGSRFSSFGQLVDVATEEGNWITTQGVNPVTKQEEPRRVLVLLHDGLVFSASHSVLVEDVAASVQEYVDKAIARYEADGLDATIAYYNSQDSLDGQFYLFFIGDDDLYLAHPIFPHLIGTDIKDVVGSDGQELGKEIALATEDGAWVEYLWPHPISRKEQQKVTWAVRHDGLIFASGYYAGEPESGPPAWRDADPRDYTVEYVHRAIERYENDGLESLLNYYNSVASFEGEWYLFATDDSDVYHIHPLLPHLIGTDIKNVVGSDGYRLGDELAKATTEGVWVEYLWPHPVTLKEVPKVGYAVRRDGMLFASGYYVPVEDPAGRTKEYVQQAIEYYNNNGLEATIDWYNSEESLDGQWGLTLADENDILRVAPLGKHLIGTALNDLATLSERQIGQEMAAAADAGSWINYVFPNIRSSETLYAHTWAVRHDGLLFMSRFYDDQFEVPDTP